jgi:hypothetical protein
MKGGAAAVYDSAGEPKGGRAGTRCVLRLAGGGSETSSGLEAHGAGMGSAGADGEGGDLGAGMCRGSARETARVG